MQERDSVRGLQTNDSYSNIGIRTTQNYVCRDIVVHSHRIERLTTLELPLCCTYKTVTYIEIQKIIYNGKNSCLVCFMASVNEKKDPENWDTFPREGADTTLDRRSTYLKQTQYVHFCDEKIVRSWRIKFMNLRKLFLRKLLTNEKSIDVGIKWNE